MVKWKKKHDWSLLQFCWLIQVLEFANPASVRDEEVFADVYHSLIHSPLSETILQGCRDRLQKRRVKTWLDCYISSYFYSFIFFFIFCSLQAKISIEHPSDVKFFWKSLLTICKLSFGKGSYYITNYNSVHYISWKPIMLVPLKPSVEKEIISKLSILLVPKMMKNSPFFITDSTTFYLIKKTWQPLRENKW